MDPKLLAQQMEARVAVLEGEIQEFNRFTPPGGPEYCAPPLLNLESQIYGLVTLLGDAGLIDPREWVVKALQHQITTLETALAAYTADRKQRAARVIVPGQNGLG